MQRRLFLQSLVGGGVVGQMPVSRAQQGGAPRAVATAHPGPVSFFSVQAVTDHSAGRDASCVWRRPFDHVPGAARFP